MEELTKAEEKIMIIFWKLKKAFVKDVLAELPGKNLRAKSWAFMPMAMQERMWPGQQKAST